ncbi:MAG: histidinol-phosphatase HisJ family protein [Clostridia bacterium]|nr:histidinol-phosphatase HisJ family protein [Clostridia bacterium]
MTRGSLHVHSTYCDGKSALRETVEAAIEKGFSYIGFSGHGHTSFDGRYCMSKENEAKYFEEIQALKEAYKGKIRILCGIERDLLSDHFVHNYDYEIASVHYIKIGDKFYDVDGSAQEQKECIDLCFDADPYAYAEEYYKSVAQLEGDIIGHFDLLTKFDRKNEIFNPREERYKKAALSSLEVLLQKDSVFEVNTGAMSRGYKDSPYPDLWILEEMKKRGARIILTSDCHYAPHLDFGYDMAEKTLNKLGFTEFYNIDFLNK